jgi:hypothetical protein
LYVQYLWWNVSNGQLKPWAEVPVPRHLLDENDDLDEKEAGFLLQYEPWTKVKLVKETPIDHLVLIAPRLAMYAELLVKKPQINVGHISSGINKKQKVPKPESHVSTDLYEYDPGDVEPDSSVAHRHHETDIILLPGTTIAVVVLPLLVPSDCYTFASEVLNVVLPTRVTVVTPCNMVSTCGNVYSLYNSSVAKTDAISGLPSLEPPFIVSGAPASLLSQCENLSIPAVGIIVKAEGPQGYEVVDHDATSFDVSRAVELALKLTPHSVGKVEGNIDRGMFI